MSLLLLAQRNGLPRGLDIPIHPTSSAVVRDQVARLRPLQIHSGGWQPNWIFVPRYMYRTPSNEMPCLRARAISCMLDLAFDMSRILLCQGFAR